MKPRVYVETTIPSYLTARPSRDPVRNAEQQITRDWWARRDRFALVTSELVFEEAGDGDPEAAADRLAALAGIPTLVSTDEVPDLARDLATSLPLPARAVNDAAHIATAAVHAVEYLLTRNCTHLANAALRRRVDRVCRARGFQAPAICTPLELPPEAADGSRG
ncbi:MAG: type II toxin-antitoxin system VapC family toxin [Gemmataceae bacterium]|nr:type II toxin-antitoxin system VapC family toxin [Gemmataceae bacterium]